MIVKIKRENDTIPMPLKATSGAAGMDLCANIEESLTILPHTPVKIKTGISIEIPDSSCVGLVFGRSGMGINHGITLSNSVGVIDSDYRGEICVGLINNSEKPYTINPMDRIAQLVFMNFINVEFEEAYELSETKRNKSGFGSTGK
ncbi:MAG: dUTP diphosphatase [Ruminococcaceae bacterium]|nr:dUTP diphosphatase [Oscillospiraceae bacterium]